jgi:hypothetical protein
MYGIYANIWGILMVNVTIYSIHGSYGVQQLVIADFQALCLSLSFSELRYYPLSSKHLRCFGHPKLSGVFPPNILTMVGFQVVRHVF